MRLVLELLVALPRFCRQRTALGTCRPVVTWKLPHHTWRVEDRKTQPGVPAPKDRPSTPLSPRGPSSCCSRLTVKAGSRGCVNLALKVCSSCLVRAL